MSDGVKLDPPGLELGRIASTTDDRISNLLRALATDRTPEAATARWALKGWQTARAGLDAVREVADDMATGGDELREIVRESLEAPTDEDDCAPE